MLKLKLPSTNDFKGLSMEIAYNALFTCTFIIIRYDEWVIQPQMKLFISLHTLPMAGFLVKMPHNR